MESSKGECETAEGKRLSMGSIVQLLFIKPVFILYELTRCTYTAWHIHFFWSRGFCSPLSRFMGAAFGWVTTFSGAVHSFGQLVTYRRGTVVPYLVGPAGKRYPYDHYQRRSDWMSCDYIRYFHRKSISKTLWAAGASFLSSLKTPSQMYKGHSFFFLPLWLRMLGISFSSHWALLACCYSTVFFCSCVLVCLFVNHSTSGWDVLYKYLYLLTISLYLSPVAEQDHLISLIRAFIDTLNHSFEPFCPCFS